MPPKVALIGLDWGTTSLRGYLLGTGGEVLAARHENFGILNVENGNFAAALRHLATDWLQADTIPPIITSGMIGSRQGWWEVPYGDLPAGPEQLLPVLFDGFDYPVHIIPGLAFRNADGIPDVMRGEETQIAGMAADGVFLLPGSHSKWVLVTGGRIIWFATFMTGEFFAALKDHTILGRMMVDGHDGDAFLRGVGVGHGTNAVLQSLFSARTLALFGDIPDVGVASYLSGLLIGAEIAEARALMDNSPSKVTIVGEAALARDYQTALSHCGLESALAPHDIAARGHWRIAQTAGLLAHD
jgi:2-dehydro-3-deoxygalactonokinase